MPTEVMTFHKMLEGCLRRDSESWRFFAADYGPLAQHLIQRHFCLLEGKWPNLLKEIFLSINQSECLFLKEFSGSSEREFLIYFKERIFAIARNHLTVEADRSNLDVKSLHKLFNNVPLAQQEVAWLGMKAYTDEEINKILRVPISLVKTGRIEILERLSKQTGDAEVQLLRLKSGILLELEALRGQNCLDIKTFSKILDGRIPWNEKRIVESHVSECLFCLDRETSLKETIFYLRELPRLSTASADSLLKELSIGDEKFSSRPSILARVMNVFR